MGNYFGGESWSGEIVNRRKDGSYIDLAVTIAPIKTPEDEITSFVSVQSDISRLKELDRLKSKFVSNVSHELRTPLTNIKLYLTLLARGKAERQEQYLEILQHEVDRLTTLVQDLLDLSRLEAEPLPDRLVRANPRTVLLELLNSFQLRAELKGITLKTAVPEHLPDVHIAENHLGQLLTNLIENALTYSPDGGEVQVGVKKRPFFAVSPSLKYRFRHWSRHCPGRLTVPVRSLLPWRVRQRRQYTRYWVGISNLPGNHSPLQWGNSGRKRTRAGGSLHRVAANSGRRV